MAATPGVNSYVDVTEATAYFADRFGYDKWPTEPDQDAALVSAAQQLDLMCYWNFPPESPMVFGDDPPQDVKDAQCEIAYSIVDTGSTSTDSGDPIERLKAGDVELEFKATSSTNPLQSDLVTKLLSPYGLCNSGSSTRLVPLLKG